MDEAHRVVQAMIEAHGGMETWAAAPTVSFEDTLTLAGAPSGVTSRVPVAQGSRSAYFDFPGTEMRLAWDGERAWSENWTLPFPPRFLALLNYYFLNLPWLTLDPGVKLGEPGSARLRGDDTEYTTIRMTFEEGVGDSSDDYYVLYIHPETHRLRACEYIVTYAAVLSEGADASPLHTLVYDAHATVDGLTVPTRYTVYEGEEVYATCEIRDWSFSGSFDDSRMTMPQGAKLDTSADGAI